MMNLVFRCMAQDKPGQPHDYAAEQKNAMTENLQDRLRA